MTEWQPISTAPRDGSQVLLFFPEFNHKVQLGHFVDTEHFNHGVSTYKKQYWAFDTIITGLPRPEPTLWMPIPPAPEPERTA